METPHPQKISAHVYCAQTAGWIKMVLGMEVGLSPSDFVLDGEPARPQKRAHSPKNSADVYCGQAAGWIKMPLGTVVDLGLGDVVLDWDAALPRKGAQQSPTFRPTALAHIPAGPPFTHNPYCRLGSARRAALVAILPNNCHPFSYGRPME